MSRRALQATAIVLLIANVALLVAWARAEPPPHDATATPPASAPPAQPARANDAAALPTAAQPSTADDAAVAPAPAAADHAVLFGTVRSADGALIGKGRVLASDDSSNASAEITGGTFTFAGLRPGSWTLRTQVEDQLPLARTIDVQAPHTRADLQLDAGWRLLVWAKTPDGAPLLDEAKKEMKGPRWFRGLSALAFAEPLRGDLPPSNLDDYTGGIGRFRGGDVYRAENVLPKDVVGLLVLPADRPAHVALMLRNVVLAQQLVQPGQESVTFTLAVRDLLARTATVRARLVDEQGAPAAGSKLALNDGNATGGGLPAGDDGRVVLQHLKPGLLNLEARGKAGAATPVQVAVHAGSDVDLGDVVLHPGKRVTFELRGGSGDVTLRTAPLPPLPRPEWRAHVQQRVHTAGDTLGLVLPAGRHGVFVQRGELCALADVDTATIPSANGTDEPVRVVLQPGAPLRIRSRLGARNGALTIRSGRGVAVLDQELTADHDATVRVPPGDYDVEMRVGDAPATRRTLHVGQGGAVVDVP